MTNQVSIICVFTMCLLGCAFVYKTEGTINVKNSICIFIISVLVCFLFYKDDQVENMSNLVYYGFDHDGNKQCYGSYNIPKRVRLNNVESDFSNTGLMFNNDSPIYANAKRNGLCGGNKSYNLVGDAIEFGVNNDLENQHNKNIVWSPHTHYGKNRSYMNWVMTNSI